MTNSKEKHGEYIHDDDGRLVRIEWYTHGNFDCEKVEEKLIEEII
jgi:hypothetical protein